jgi:type III restriction enzyme
VTLRIDSKLLAAAENEDPNATRKEAAEDLRKIVSTVGRVGEAGEHIRCVVSVNMLSEGWDANNVTHILGLRAFHSQLLCEQVVGRGLRRMDYTPDPATGLLTAEYVDIFGVPFSLIPFKGRQPGGSAPPEDRPKHEVMALPERKAFEIRFPVVEGYVVSLKRNAIMAEVDKVERTKLDPWTTPTDAFVRPQVGYQIGQASAHGGFGFDLVNRQEYYDSVHPQTIEFEITREIVRALTDAEHPGKEQLRRESRSTLFPQVLRIVQTYIRHRVDFNGLNPCDVGLQTYAQRIIGLLIAAITPDDSKGEAPLLPRLNRSRPIDSTERVRFKTVKPVQLTGASHLNFVACDTNSWEQAATFQLEKLAKQGVVFCYARNERLEFNIPYELYGNPHVYEPDFIVRLRNSVNVVTEIKGKQHEDTDAKHQAAKRWVSAVNHWGRLGEWDFLVCREPQRLGEELKKLVAARTARIRTVAADLKAQAEGELGRLRSLGWKQADFARALKDLMETRGAD